jgi:hypothetical protein
MSEKYTPEEIAESTESRITHDAKLIEGGAHYLPDEKGEPVLRATSKQVGRLKNQDQSTAEKKERKERTEILRTFSTQDQIGELDFKKFLDKPLFGSYYRANTEKGDPFQETVYDGSKPFNDIKGRLFNEIQIKEVIGEKAVLAERGIEPISLNEWRYLLTQLTEEQLQGKTYYLVQFDDGIVHSIEASLDKSGGGPYGYSMLMRKLSPQDSFSDNIKPRIISPSRTE